MVGGGGERKNPNRTIRAVTRFDVYIHFILNSPSADGVVGELECAYVADPTGTQLFEKVADLCFTVSSDGLLR